jgi:hypothetical protein
MRNVLAVIDDDPVRRRVLDVAHVLGRIYGGVVVPLHVLEPGGAPPPSDHHGEPTLLRRGNVVDEIVAAIGDDAIVAASIGASARPGGHRPGGSVSLAVAERVRKPLALVPPESPTPRPGQHLRLLAPLDGTEQSADAVAGLLRLLHDTDVEVVVVHVFTPATMPRFLDRPEHDLVTWADEFSVRHCAGTGPRVTWRRGVPAETIAEVARDERVDGVIMAWARDLAPGRAAAVRGTLVSAGVPVLLLPRDGEP